MPQLPGQDIRVIPLVKMNGEGIGTVSMRYDVLEELAQMRERLALSYEMVEYWVGDKKGYEIRSFAIVPEPVIEDQSNEREKGVWVTYTKNHDPIAGQIFEEEIDALRSAVKRMDAVVFVPFGKTIREVIDGEG